MEIDDFPLGHALVFGSQLADGLLADTVIENYAMR
jgi:hypothetical protein